MRFARGGRALERLAGGSGGSVAGGRRPAGHWHTRRTGADPWRTAGATVAAPAWLHDRPGGVARTALQQSLLFPVCRWLAHPEVSGAERLHHAPQPAVLAANHASDLDTPLILDALPHAWRTRTRVAAAEDRFYRRRRYAVTSALWINTFAFDRSNPAGGLARAAQLLDEGCNVLLYPQATRSAGQLAGFRAGVARLCLACDAPAIPIHVGGTALLWPKQRGLSQRGRTTMRFGAPLYAEPHERPAAFGRRLAEAVAELAGSAT